MIQTAMKGEQELGGYGYNGLFFSGCLGGWKTTTYCET